MRMMIVTAAAALAAISTAQAQQGQDRLLREPYVTSTGETVPNPGRSQSGGVTPLDRGIKQQDNKIDSSICKGC